MHQYTRISLLKIPSTPDGEHVLVMGIYERHQHGATVSQRGVSLDLVGETFDWLPEHGAPTEVWGVLWQGTVPRLLVHNARRLGDTSRMPETTADVSVGDLITITARITCYGDQQVCCTADRQSYLLRGKPLDEQLSLISGQILSLRPPTLRLISAVPIQSVDHTSATSSPEETL